MFYRLPKNIPYGMDKSEMYFFFLGFVSGKLNFLGEKSVHAKEVVPTTDPPGVT